MRGTCLKMFHQKGFGSLKTAGWTGRNCLMSEGSHHRRVACHCNRLNNVSPRGLDRNLLRAFLILEDCTIVLPRDLDRDLARILSVLTEVRGLLGFAAESLRELVIREDRGLTPAWRTMARNEIVTATSP